MIIPPVMLKRYGHVSKIRHVAASQSVQNWTKARSLKEEKKKKKKPFKLVISPNQMHLVLPKR